jgi:hypothetical protein
MKRSSIRGSYNDRIKQPQSQEEPDSYERRKEVRKIISILVALGLVLALSATAVPVGAAACADSTATHNCTGETATYTINYSAPVTLEPVNDLLSVTFPAGTTFATFAAGDIKVNNFDVDITTLVVAAPKLEFQVPPLAGVIVAGNQVKIEIAGVKNGPAGTANICLDYNLDCCGEVEFCCVPYTILPAYSTYGILVDFDPTYPGIALDFVPPFKACGQNDTTGNNHTFNTTFFDPNWYSQFDLILALEEEGCAAPCVNATLCFNVTSFPAEAVSPHVSLNISGEFFVLTPTASSDCLAANVTLNVSGNSTFPSLLHFDEVGDYSICFEFTCPGTPGGSCQTTPPCVAGDDIVIAEGCYDFEVHQWKDAAKIVLKEKWNLISLPLVPFDTDIDVLLESLSAAGLADLVSIWSYDTASTDWTMYSGGGLTEMVDGKSYWVYMKYPTGASFDWWVWGLEHPRKPAALHHR